MGIIYHMDAVKKLVWMASSKKDLKTMPAQVQDVFGYALYLAQIGKKFPKTKPLHGFGSAAVLEIVEDVGTNAYRAVYTVRFSDAVFVLHCFQKKSTRGIATPKPDMDLIIDRLKQAEKLSKEKSSNGRI